MICLKLFKENVDSWQLTPMGSIVWTHFLKNYKLTGRSSVALLRGRMPANYPTKALVLSSDGRFWPESRLLPVIERGHLEHCLRKSPSSGDVLPYGDHYAKLTLIKTPSHSTGLSRVSDVLNAPDHSSSPLRWHLGYSSG